MTFHNVPCPRPHGDPPTVRVVDGDAELAYVIIRLLR